MSARPSQGPVPGAADWLRLAPAPTFALMALLTGPLAASPMDAMCGGGGHGLSLGGMVPMYLLMSAFHAGPWLKLATGCRRRPAAAS